MKPKDEKKDKGVATGGTAVETTTDKDKAVGSVMQDFSADAGAGLEGTDKSSFAIPFIVALQGNSPQIEKLDGAKPGMFLNSITNELMKEVFVIPCAFHRRFVRWAPRSEGGGYKGDYSPVDVELGHIECLTQDGQAYLIGDDELKDTRNHYCLVKTSDGVWTPAVISLTSTQIKKSKRWMSRIQTIELRSPAGKPYTPPSFSHIYKATTIKEENSKGAWHGWEIEMIEPVADAELYTKAKVFHDAVMAGTVQVAPPEPPTDDEGGNRATGSKF